jgi:hypothetical protein
MAGAPKGSSNAKTHGMFSLRDSGPAKLTDPVQISRMSQLRQMAKTEPGRQEIREEITARMALICDLGYAELARQRQAGESIWDSGVIRRLATYTAETRRLLDSFQDNEAQGSASSIIAKMVDDHEQNNTT